jgi:hypothetical protein
MTEETAHLDHWVQPGPVEQSHEIGELAKAMAMVQGEIRNPVYDAVNPHYRSKYASLAAIMNVLRPKMSKYGIAMTQQPCSNGERIGVTTTIMHESGQWQRSTLFLKADKDNIHGAGSTLTYLKRYSATGPWCIAGEEDDDGNAAVGKPAIAKVVPLEGPPEEPKADLDAVKTKKPNFTLDRIQKGLIKYFEVQPDEKARLLDAYLLLVVNAVYAGRSGRKPNPWKLGQSALDEVGEWLSEKVKDNADGKTDFSAEAIEDAIKAAHKDITKVAEG